MNSEIMRLVEINDFKLFILSAGALTTLASEVNPDPNIDAVEPSVAYRKNVAIGYLYSVNNFIIYLSTYASQRYSPFLLMQRKTITNQSFYLCLC